MHNRKHDAFSTLNIMKIVVYISCISRICKNNRETTEDLNQHFKKGAFRIETGGPVVF